MNCIITPLATNINVPITFSVMTLPNISNEIKNIPKIRGSRNVGSTADGYARRPLDLS